MFSGRILANFSYLWGGGRRYGIESMYKRKIYKKSNLQNKRKNQKIQGRIDKYCIRKKNIIKNSIFSALAFCFLVPFIIDPAWSSLQQVILGIPYILSSFHSISLFLCLSDSLPLSLSVSQSLCLSVSRAFCLTVSLSFFLSHYSRYYWLSNASCPSISFFFLIHSRSFFLSLSDSLSLSSSFSTKCICSRNFLKPRVKPQLGNIWKVIIQRDFI